MKDYNLVDIILPLAIADVYTYRIPLANPSPLTSAVLSTADIGKRVLVPLGKKSIIGIIYRPHEGTLPKHVKVRDVVQIIDQTPIVTAQQLRLWEWLSQYYMCTLGEVLAAALPSEIIDDNYAAATCQYISLPPTLLDHHAQEALLSSFGRAKKQELLFRTFLDLAQGQWQVERRVLLESSGVSGAILRLLIDKGIFLEEEHPISRLRRYSGAIGAPHPLDTQQQNAANAIRQACQRESTFNLKGCVIYSSCEPCPMCLSALYWAGVSRIYYGCTQEDAEAVNFSDRFIYRELEKPKCDRMIPCIKMDSTRTIKVFEKWADKADKIEY